MSENNANHEIIYRDDVTVELVKASASDADVIWAARVSTAGEQSLDEIGEDPARSAGLINYLARERHGSPFEHTSMTFFVSAPIFVFREFMRHRIASYNEESGRYRELNPVFYIPSKERKLVQVGKTGSYTFENGTKEQFEISVKAMKEAYVIAYESYKKMLDAGVAREVARVVLPVSTYSSMYVSMNARALMNFLSLRTARDHRTRRHGFRARPVSHLLGLVAWRRPHDLAGGLRYPLEPQSPMGRLSHLAARALPARSLAEV
jgi:thymidylate synthase (FAD)